tara:strand:+ start:278 stop:508 length:231 start_codon:yes stop_codon:yes gene_type:complete
MRPSALPHPEKQWRFNRLLRKRMNPPHLMGWHVVVLVRWWYAVRLYLPDLGYWDLERLFYLCLNLKNQSEKRLKKR